MSDNDFFDEYFSDLSSDESPDEKEEIDLKGKLTEEKMAEHSYLVSNALINILVAKGIVSPQEINSILQELHEQYRSLRGDSHD